MVRHITNGKEYLSVDTENERYTMERICPVEDYELVKDCEFVAERRKLFKNDNYRQRWILPKKLSTVAITDDGDSSIFIPKRNGRNSRNKYCTRRMFA